MSRLTPLRASGRFRVMMPVRSAVEYRTADTPRSASRHELENYSDWSVHTPCDRCDAASAPELADRVP